MPDGDYLISIIAKFRDDTAAGIQKLKREIDDLKAHAAASNLGGDAGNLADEVDRAAQSHRDLSQSHRDVRKEAQQTNSELQRTGHELAKGEQRAQDHADAVSSAAESHHALQTEVGQTASTIRDSTQHFDKGTQSVKEQAARVQDLGAGMRDTAGGAEELATAQQRLQKRTDEALQTFDELSGSFEKGSGNLRQLRQDLQASGQELGALSKRFKTTSDEARGLREVAEDAAAMAKSLSTLQSGSRQPISDALGINKAQQDLQKLTRDYQQFTAQAHAAADQEATRLTSRLFASRFGSVARALPVGTPEFGSAIQSQITARALSASLAPQKEVRDAMADTVTKGDQLIQRMGQLDQAARHHTATNKELETGYRQVESGLRSVGRAMEVGSSDARRFSSAMEDAGKKAGNIDLARANSGFSRFAQDFAHSTDQIGIKVISLSAALRGVRLVALVGLFQPLITGLTSLAGGLFSVASGAVQAGASLGGVFLSGLGQMIPMISVAVAGLIRLRDIFQAVQAAQAARQEAFFQPGQGLITQLQNTSQLIASEQNLKNAYFGLQDAQVQVRLSTIQLTQARIDAVRNLQDLTLAEQQAKLELKGSHLSLIQAQEELRAAEASGQQQRIQQAQLAVQEAQLGVGRARLGVPRAEQNLQIALNYGISGSPTVLGATEAARQARLAVTQQQQAIAAAQRQMQITRLTLAQPASHETQQQATLQYLLGQMSPIEKALFSSLNSIETQLRSPNGPLKRITDAFIEPFVGISQRLQQLLSDPKFLGPIQKLADAMGGGLRSVFGTMFGQRGTSFFETMAKDATRSIPIVTRAITGLMKVFEDIATAAAPAFQMLSRDWANFWNAMDRRDRTPQGQDRLTNFFNQGAKWAEDFAHLAGAIFDLFKALGRDAAPQGMKTVKSFTEAIHDATTWVQNNGPAVTNFFNQTRQGLALLGGVLFNIGKALLQVFSLTSLQAFAGLLNTIVIPAAREVANIIGFFITKIMQLVNAFGPAKVLLEGLVGAFLGLMVLNRMISVVTRATDVVHGLHDAFAAFKAASDVGWFSRIGSAWEALTTRITKGKTALEGVKGAQEAVAAESKVAAAAEIESVTAVDTALTTEIGLERTAVGGAIPGAAGGAGLSTAEGAAGGFTAASIARFGLTRALPVAALAYVADKTNVFGNNLSTGKSTKGDLASLVGKIGGTHRAGIGAVLNQANPFGADDPFGAVGTLITGGASVSNQSSSTTAGLKALQDGLKGITDPAQLSTTRLQVLFNQAQQILQMPDITATQRAGLEKLVYKLNPAVVAMQKATNQAQIMGTVWGQTFQGINSTTGNVMQQVQQTLSADIQKISANLGSGTKQGAQALVQTTAAAWQTVLDNTSAAVRGTSKAIGVLNTMLNHALKAMGQGNVSLGTSAGQINPSTDTGIITGLTTGQLTAGGVMSPKASGGWTHARPGGQIIQAGEGGHDEVTLTTDPRYAGRQRALLSQYLSRSPHLAKGGKLGNASIYQSPFGNAVPTFTRTDMGVDVSLTPGTPIGVVGNARVAGVLPNWYAGQPYVYYQLTDGPDAGRYIYVAEQISGVPGVSAYDPRATKSLQSEIGQHLGKGQRLGYFATAGTGIETGWGTASGATLAQATGATGDATHGNAPAGIAFRSFLTGLQHGIITGGGGATGAGIAQMLTAPKVKGVKGVFGQITQGIVNKATAAANQMLGSKGGGTAGITPSGPAHPGNAAQKAIVAAAAAKWGIPASFLWGVYGDETSFGTNLSTSTTGAQGYFQFEPATAAAYGVNPYNFSSSAYGAAHLLSTGKSGGDLGMVKVFYGAADQGYLDRVLGFAKQYAAGGLLTRHLRRMGVRRLRKSIMRFADGGRAPWGGEPVPIVAHEGERISNPNQWDEISRMAGTTPAGLDNHLGYDRGSPRQNFAPGGTVWSSRTVDTRATASSASGASISSVMSLLQTFSGNLYKMDPGSLAGALDVISKLFKAVTDGFTKIGKLGGADTSKRLTQISTLLSAFADPSNTASTLNLLSAALQRFQANLSNWIVGLSYTAQQLSGRGVAQQFSKGGVIPTTGPLAGMVTGSGDNVAMRGNLNTGNIGHVGATAIDLLTERSLVEQSQFLGGEQKAVTESIRRVKQGIQAVRSATNISKATRTKALSTLESQYTNLIQQQEALATSMNNAVTQRFQQEQQYVQDSLNQVADIFQTQQTKIQAQQSSAQALGQFSQLPSIDQALGNSAKAQIAALQPVLREAQKINDPDLVAQIQQQIAQLQQTVVESAAQMIQDSISTIQQTSQTQQGRVSMLQSISQTMTATAATPGQFAQAGAVNMQALQLNQSSLQGQIGQYNTLLGQAVTQGNQGAVATLTQTIDQLTGQLVQNMQAIEDNTAQVITQTSQFIQARGQFQSGIYGGLGQIISTIGQTTGFTDVGTLKSLTQASTSALTGTQGGLLGQLSALGGGASGLAGMLGQASTPAQFVAALGGANIPGIEAGHDSTWINAFEGLIQNLESNTSAIAQNNQQLATLNGQLLQPQQWSTSAWSSFRDAIFSGMGNLLPQYQASLPTGAGPMIAPMFGVAGSSVTVPAVGTLNINHAPSAAVDPAIIGAQLAHEVNTSLN